MMRRALCCYRVRMCGCLSLYPRVFLPALEPGYRCRKPPRRARGMMCRALCLRTHGCVSLCSCVPLRAGAAWDRLGQSKVIRARFKTNLFTFFRDEISGHTHVRTYTHTHRTKCDRSRVPPPRPTLPTSVELLHPGSDTRACKPGAVAIRSERM